MEIKSLSWNTGDKLKMTWEWKNLYYLVSYYYTIYTSTIQYSSYRKYSHLDLN